MEISTEILEQFGDWYKTLLTLRDWGRLLEAQENWTEAVKIYIQTLAIDLEHNKEGIGLDINDLGRMLKQLGESQFDAIWREFTGEDCAGELREAIWAARDTLEAE